MTATGLAAGAGLMLFFVCIDLPAKLGGAALLAYAAAMGIAIADYGIKHPDEFPSESERR